MLSILLSYILPHTWVTSQVPSPQGLARALAPVSYLGEQRLQPSEWHGHDDEDDALPVISKVAPCEPPTLASGPGVTVALLAGARGSWGADAA